MLFFIPGGSDGKASAYNAGDLGSIPGLGRFLGEGNCDPLQHSCLEKSHRRRSLVQATVHGVVKSRARLSDFTFTLRMEENIFDILCFIISREVKMQLKCKKRFVQCMEVF